MEKFKRVLRTVAEILSENMDMARVFLVELRQTTEALSYLAPKLEKEYNFLIKKLLQEAKDQGYVRQDINVHIVSIASLGLI
ncbi:MAG TPA: TetR/AcrR family transcriptional regulator C-terminal domain-containing protein, partial [Candidatus Mcinerneyibacteriales bacterium]|nr:TetR/AcrR family transcriptional regulator C-terminal domain-containing protein [Candidatus Mcinerneyibacteriales bacterium]